MIIPSLVGLHSCLFVSISFPSISTKPNLTLNLPACCFSLPPCLTCPIMFGFLVKSQDQSQSSFTISLGQVLVKYQYQSGSCSSLVQVLFKSCSSLVQVLVKSSSSLGLCLGQVSNSVWIFVKSQSVSGAWQSFSISPGLGQVSVWVLVIIIKKKPQSGSW